MPYSQLVMQRECLRPQCLGHRCCSESPQNQHILLLCALPLLQDRPRNLEAKGPWKDIDGSQKGSFRVQAEGRWRWTAPSHFRPGQSRSDGAHSPLQGTSTLWAVVQGSQPGHRGFQRMPHSPSSSSRASFWLRTVSVLPFGRP